MFARSSSSFWFDPRSRSHLKTEHFRGTPDVIGQPCCHGWCAFVPEMLSVTQLLMRPTEVVGTADQIHSHLQGFQTLGGMATFTGERSQTLPHGCIETFNQGRIELLTSDGPVQQVLCFLKRSQRYLARDLHHPFLLCAFDHSGDTQLRPHL